MREQTAATIRWQSSTRSSHRGRVRCVRVCVCLCVSVPGVVASSNPCEPRLCGVWMIYWTANVGVLALDALFTCFSCTGSGGWPSMADTGTD